MDEGYSEEDAVLNAKLAILEAQKVARHTQDFVIIADRWLNLANFIRNGKSDPPTWKEG